MRGVIERRGYEVALEHLIHKFGGCFDAHSQFFGEIRRHLSLYAADLFLP